MGLAKYYKKDYYETGDLGYYQFITLDDIITHFEIAYVGENKIIPKVKRADIAFHAQRAIQELSFDTFKSCRSQEITVPATLQMALPYDYVNYTKISWLDSAGIKHPLYPTNRTSNPLKINQNSDGTYYTNLILNSNFQDGTDQKDYPYPNTMLPANWQFVNLGTSGDASQDTLLSYTTSSDGILISSNGVGGGIYPILQQRIELEDGITYKLSWNLVSVNDGSATLKSKVFIYGGAGGGVNTYRPTGNVELTTTGEQTAIEFTFDASQNNGLRSMMLAIEITDGGNNSKSVGIKDFLLVKVNNDGNYDTTEGSFIDTAGSTTWSNYKSSTPSENNNDDYEDDTYWPLDGQRYGLDPQHAQTNGSFYIDCNAGKIHFSSNISGKTVILDYMSDNLNEGEPQVHKFAEEAMYKWIAHGILSTSSLPVHQQLVPRFKKEKFAATRQAKLRLSNIKLEELTQILRGKSKQIKH